MDRISDLILHLAFYWYNFMPLSRGTAAVGYMTMIGLFLSLDYEIAVATPPNTQVDWEAILGPSPAAFIKASLALSLSFSLFLPLSVPSVITLIRSPLSLPPSILPASCAVGMRDASPDHISVALPRSHALHDSQKPAARLDAHQHLPPDDQR
jgi:hypothetical protein